MTYLRTPAAGMRTYHGPWYGSAIDILNDLIQDGGLTPLDLHRAAQLVTGYTPESDDAYDGSGKSWPYAKGYTTRDDYSWAGVLPFLRGEQQVLILLPRRDGQGNLERSVAMYFLNVCGGTCKQILTDLTKAVTALVPA